MPRSRRGALQNILGVSLSYQRHSAFKEPVVAVIKGHNKYVVVGVHVLLYTIESAIPALLCIGGSEYALSPAVVYAELYQLLILHADRAEDVIEPIAVRCEC